ncbi:T9SS type B sorting domain-containing protein [Algoriphagus halophilus]|uniref:Conserved repeat domain-containing protein/gliding motility-associated C-terminal domain-containing protein n=1 Tax=Algoriphagus halophilus TaxID=226505 RepID=A0A1N6D317_9BACT|nr:gliding motility-associated C-terminal domain-containing protein [Algoriphagus halophilus]SIN65103.1 conserved repeat domain-containing protein/gliding motility-associated C-terminal domain-containing protein [Algoriphagus halophilus]
MTRSLLYQCLPVFVGLLCCGQTVFAQFVNTGKLSVKEGAIIWSALPFENRTNASFINDGTVIFLSDVANEGEFTFSQSEETGLLRLEGLSGQSLTGSSQINTRNLLLSNNSDFILSNDLQVSGLADFQAGVVRASSADDIFGFAVGANSENSSDESFVDGKVGAAIERQLLFPTGNAAFRRILFASPIPAGNKLNVTARYFLEDPGNLYPRDQTALNVVLVDDAEYWELENLEESKRDLSLTLSWRDVTTPPFILGDLNKIGIVRWDETDSQWVSEGGEIDLPGQLVSSAVTLSGTSVYTLGVLTGFTNLGLTKTSFDLSIWEGDQFDYQITLQNNSQVAATDVVLVDNLPRELEFVSVEGESIFGLLEFDVEVVGQSVIIRIPEFIGGDEATFTLRVRAADPGRIINVAEVSSFEPDEDPSDNLDTDENEVKSFFIPNVITPNSDGFNDQFEIKGLNKFVSNKLTIFSRWGDSILEEDNYSNNWEAEGLVAGTYFYILDVVEEDGSTQSFKGWIQVIKKD